MKRIKNLERRPPIQNESYEVKVERNVCFGMRDGVHLAADVYRPNAERKFPALLLCISAYCLYIMFVPQVAMFLPSVMQQTNNG